MFLFLQPPIMSSDFSKLKSYLNETNGGSSSNSTSNKLEETFSNAKTTVFDFFNNKLGTSGGSSTINLADSRNGDDQAEGWFKEADSDPYCPKLVGASILFQSMTKKLLWLLSIKLKKKSKKQRVIGFILCLLMGAFCFFCSSFYIPVLLLKSRKFVLLFSLGSVFFIARWLYSLCFFYLMQRCYKNVIKILFD